MIKVLRAICVLAVFVGTSCEKKPDKLPNIPEAERRIQFILYTDKDFSNDNDSIFFSITIRNAQGQILLNSSLAPMVIKDIPSFSNKIVIEEKVPDNDASKLKAGFLYYIKNVGYSWHLDSLNAGETFKIVEYNFQ